MRGAANLQNRVMATSDELIAAIAAAGKSIAENKVSSFREHETAAEFHSLSSLGSLLMTLSDEEVRAAIDAGSGGTITKFRPICG